MNEVETPLLYGLAFGQAIAQTERSANALQERMSHSQGWESSYNFVGHPDTFATQTASLALRGLRMTAVSHSPFRSKVIAKSTSTLVVPLAGERSVSLINGREVAMTPGVSAAFAPPGERVGSGGYRSVLMVDVDPERLQSTWRTMQGPAEGVHRDLDVDTPRALSLRVHGRTLAHLCGIVDQFCTHPQTLNMLGVDESIYRLLALQMGASCGEDEAGAQAAQGGQPFDPLNAKRLDQACQYVVAHLAEAITLTDLERVANLSSRALQYAFLKRFACTPMHWVREQRLMAVHRRLVVAGPDDSVSSLAMSFGFFSLSKFSAAYKARFGERPSDTLRHSLRR